MQSLKNLNWKEMGMYSMRLAAALERYRGSVELHEREEGASPGSSEASKALKGIEASLNKCQEILNGIDGVVETTKTDKKTCLHVVSILEDELRQELRRIQKQLLKLPKRSS